MTYEKELEKFYLKKYEKENQTQRNKNENQIKILIDEKDKKYQDVLSELRRQREIVKEYKNSFISLNDHEILLNNLKNDLEREINKYKGKLDSIQFKNEESDFTNIDTHKNNDSISKNACVFIYIIKQEINLCRIN